MTEVNHSWLRDYSQRYTNLFSEPVFDQLISFHHLAQKLKDSGGTLFFAGNGASAAIASHAALDFTKQAKLRSQCFNEASLITAYANDFGYENWVKEALRSYAKPTDAVVLISTSGKSPNLVNAAHYARDKGLPLVTFTGFGAENPLKQLGDINFWYEQRAYNVVECVHMTWVTTVIDMLIGRAEYSV